eukprot:3110662-Amphidinium_carterae.4
MRLRTHPTVRKHSRCVRTKASSCPLNWAVAFALQGVHFNLMTRRILEAPFEHRACCQNSVWAMCLGMTWVESLECLSCAPSVRPSATAKAWKPSLQGQARHVLSLPM